MLILLPKAGDKQNVLNRAVTKYSTVDSDLLPSYQIGPEPNKGISVVNPKERGYLKRFDIRSLSCLDIKEVGTEPKSQIEALVD